MANNQIKVNLMFQADTQKAKNSLKQLQTDLNAITTASVNGEFKLTDKVIEGQRAAVQLKNILNECVNMDTGKFDLSKFSHSLKKGGTDLKQMAAQLQQLGPEGSRAFMSLAQSIVQAEIPTKRVSAQLAQMAKTIKDTARWQISSSIIHGFQGALENAYGYAQDLNRSLNDIRIVTGYSEKYMANFAIEANKAAKALSATTKEYTEASLIYFQQGLSDEQVAQRTATTIKLANVTGQSAEDVSSYMTAVWNNFDDGTKSLEYYADAIAALGATTASSSEEIATGLQKFSAVANTVGLSYEYATAALATVTSQTRESAETVGTAFKTIFARLESLSLGETLDDETTMTKYSQALAKVGVNIKTANGQLKDMDTIIDELGQKWDSIGKDQQIALAQTVAGMRQYNNFIALMDNYDTFTANVDIAVNSEGDLSEQAEIYAESWEAAKDRATAAAEALYDKLLDDKTFIKITDTFTKLLELIDKFVDSAGGLKGILTMLAGVLTKLFNQQLAHGMENMVYNFKSFFGLAKKEAVSLKTQMAALVDSWVPAGGYTTDAERLELQFLKDRIGLQVDYAENEARLTEQQKVRIRNEMMFLEMAQQAQVKNEERLAAAQDKQVSIGLSVKSTAKKGVDVNKAADAWKTQREENKAQVENAEAKLQKFNDLVNQLRESAARGEGTLSGFTEEVEKLIAETTQDLGEDNPLSRYMQESVNSIKDQTGRPNFKVAEGYIETSVEESQPSIYGASQEQIQQEDILAQIRTQGEHEFQEQTGISVEKIEEYIDARDETIQIEEDNQKSAKKLKENYEKLDDEIQNGTDATVDYYSEFINLTSATTSLISVFSSLESAWETINDPELSGWERFTSFVMSMGTAIPMLITSIKGFSSAYESLNKIQAIANATTVTKLGLSALEIIHDKTKLASLRELIAAEDEKQLKEKFGLGLSGAKLIADLIDIATTKGLTKEKRAAALAEILQQAALGGSIPVKLAAAAATTVLAIAEYTAASPLLILVAAVALLMVGLVALIGVIMLAVAAFKAIKDASPAEQLKKAQEEAKAFATALDEAKERANELKNAFEEYNTIQDKLYECTRGTEAWNEALQENNDKVLELMEKYPQLVTMMNEVGERAITRENGVLTIADWAQEEMLDASQRSVANMTAAYYSATANVRDRQVEVESNKYENTKFVDNDGFGWRGAKISKDSKGMSQAYFKTGLELNPMLDTIRKTYGNEFDKDDVLKVVEKQRPGTSITNQLTNEEIAQIIMDFTTETSELQKQLRANEEATKAQTEAYKNSLLGDNDTVQGSKYSEQIIAATSTEDDEQLDKRIQAEMDKMDKEAGSQGWGGQGISKATGVNETARDIFQQYVEAAGLNDVTLIDTTGNDSNRVFVYTDGSGEPKKISLDHMKRVVAASRAGTAIETEAEGLTEIYERVDSDKGAGAITAATAGNTSYLSRYQLAQGIDASEFNFTEEELNLMGFDTLKDFQDALNKSVELANTEFADAQKTFIGGETGIAADAIGDIIEKGKSVKELQQLTDAQLLGYGQSIDALYQNSGKETADNYVKAMDQIITNNADKAGQIMEIASGFDWTQGPAAAMSQLEGKLSEIDVAIDTTQESWIEFITTLEQNSKMSVLAFNLDTIRTSLQKIKSLVEDVEIGSIVSDEDYKELLKYDGALHKFFQMTEDGYRYIGEQPLSEVINSVAEQQLAQGLEANARARAGAAKANEANYKYNKETVATDISNIDDSVFAALGEDKEALEELAAQANSSDPKVAERAQEELMTFYDKIDTLRQNAAMGMYDDSKNYQLYASQYSTKSQLEAKRDEFEEAGQMDAYNKQMEFLENQAKVLLEEYNKELDNLRLESLQEEFDELMEMSGKSSDAVDLLKQQSDIYAKSMADTETEIAELGEQYGLTQQDGESLGEFMDRIAHEAPQEAEKILELSENIKTAGNNLKELDSMLADALLKHFEDVQEGWDETLEEYERDADHLSHYTDVLELSGAAGNNSELMSQLANAQSQTAKVKFGVSRQNYEEIRASRSEVEARLNDALNSGDEKEVAKWQETLDTIIEMENDALDEMNSNWTEALETAAETLETNTQRIMSAFEKSMAGIYGSFDRMQEVFDQQSELNSQYVADYKKVYELSKLTRNIQGEIDNTDSVAAKKKLREFEQEINELQADGVKMSEYDLEYQQKSYDLLLAELALEEARNAKNQVRLTRTADGSWGYVYTQNSEAVEEAEQNWEDKLYELQELNSSYLEETGAAIIQTQADFNEAIEEIMSSGMSDEEKRAQIAETVAFYQEKLGFLTAEYDNVIANNQGMAGTIQAFSDSLLGMMYPGDEFTDADTVFDKWVTELGSMEDGTGILGQLNQELENYSNSVDEIFKISGANSIEDYINGINESLNGEDGLVNKLDATIEDMKEFKPEDMELQALDSLLEKIGEYRAQIEEELGKIETAYNDFLKNEKKEESNSSSQVVYQGGQIRTMPQIPRLALTPQELPGETIDNTTVRNRIEGGIAETSGNQMPGNIGTGYLGTNTGGGGGGEPPTILLFEPGLNKWSLLGMDTGGYTGEWGPEGRLAVLHEKEIVLNANDTQNLLRTMEVMDQLIKNIELQALQAAFNPLTVPSVHASGDTLQQEVTIHAEFPNATNHSEIEQAFDTLINRAAQYTNRKRY